jgi:hypothetical protein
MRVGEYIFANTHAELLNELLGTDYKGYMKCAKALPDGKLLWMIELGDFISKSGWKNRLISLERISEKQVMKEFDSHDTYKMKGECFDERDRVVFEMVRLGSCRKYIFRGVFRLNQDECKLDENIWDLICDEYTL